MQLLHNGLARRVRATRRRLTATMLIGFTVAGLGLSASLVGASPASASSTKCAFYGIGIKYGVRNGSFCDTVNGSGTYISTINGNFGTTIAGPNAVCNPSMKVDIFDRSGRWIAWRQGPQKGGCYPWAINYPPSIGVYASFPGASGGSARVSLQSYGQTVVENWHGLS